MSNGPITLAAAENVQRVMAGVTAPVKVFTSEPFPGSRKQLGSYFEMPSLRHERHTG